MSNSDFAIWCQIFYFILQLPNLNKTPTLAFDENINFKDIELNVKMINFLSFDSLRFTFSAQPALSRISVEKFRSVI